MFVKEEIKVESVASTSRYPLTIVKEESKAETKKPFVLSYDLYDQK